jgi:outer membrane receptor for ferrienterochelin and colicin
MSMKRHTLNQAFRLALSVGLVSTLANYTHVTYAQDASNEKEIEEIVVTGSHIKRNTFNYSTPVTVIDDVEISATGTTNLGDLLQTLPQTISTFNNANTAFFTTFSGLNLTDLRYLGTDRTLVLVNGRRFVSGAPPGGGYGVDLNSIPTGIIDRVEVLTGGASAIYGSDAVAGVVNIITRTDFEGIDLDVQFGAATEGDKEKQDVTITRAANSARVDRPWYPWVIRTTIRCVRATGISRGLTWCFPTRMATALAKRRFISAPVSRRRAGWED